MIDQDHMSTHLSDVERLQRIAFANGVPATLEQAYAAWAEYSEQSAAGWLILPENPEWIWGSLSDRLGNVVDAATSPANSEFDAFYEDIERIREIAQRSGHYLSSAEAYAAWEKASQKEGRDWIDLPGYDSGIEEGLNGVLHEA